jgi:hypothetical protein
MIPRIHGQRSLVVASMRAASQACPLIGKIIIRTYEVRKRPHADFSRLDCKVGREWETTRTVRGLPP